MLTSMKVKRLFEESVQPMKESAKQNRPGFVGFVKFYDVLSFIGQCICNVRFTYAVLQVYLVCDELFADFLHTWDLEQSGNLCNCHHMILGTLSSLQSEMEYLGGQIYCLFLSPRKSISSLSHL